MYNGVLLVGERLTGISTLPAERRQAPRRALNLLLVVIGWVLFRASSLGEAAHFYKAMFSLHLGQVSAAVDAAATPAAKIALAVGLATALLPRDLVIGRVLLGRWDGAPLAARLGVIALLPLAAITVAAGSFSPFLYFRF
jgi:alginate O-acetyltransferase complex protein AlgI